MSAISLFLCGDVMTGRGVDQILPHPSAPEIFETWIRDARDYVDMAEETNGAIPRPVGFDYVWGDALSELRSADVRIVNLETSVTRDGQAWVDKEVHYRMHPDNSSCLTAARVDVCVLANNHVLDWGRDGLIETLKTLHRAHIQTAGAGRTLAEAEGIATVAVGRGRVGVLGLGATSSGIPDEWAATARDPGVALTRCSEREADAIGERVARTKRPGDVLVVSLHWGSNWGYEVEEEHVAFAHALLERGVDVVHGHSSHHARPIEIHRGRLVLYGCGDFIDDYEGIGGHEGFRADLVLAYFPRLDPATGGLLELRIVPMRVRKMRLEHTSPDDTAWLSETLSRISAPYGSRVAVADDESLLVRAAR
jgi:poly-gamma-glutamate synthesis protein (capsule biosynthesis protein)